MKKRTFLFCLVVVLGFASGVYAQVPNLQFDSDVSANLRAQVLDDFAFMTGIVGAKASPIHQETFGAVNGANYLQWFNQRVFYFGVDACGGNSAVACVKIKDKNKIYVTLNYIKIQHPQIARLMTLYHEARHTEEDHQNWPHAKCPLRFPYRSIWTGSRLRLSSACDSTAYGSYASASVLLNNISKFCENCSEKVKADAKLYANDQVKRVINSAAIKALKADFAF